MHDHPAAAETRPRRVSTWPTAHGSPSTIRDVSAQWTCCPTPQIDGAAQAATRPSLDPNRWATRSTRSYLVDRLQRARTAPIKSALLDQRNRSGTGQHLCLRGALSRASITPRRKAGQLSRRPRGAARWSQSSAKCFQDAIAAGGSSLRDFRQTRWRTRLFPAQLSTFTGAKPSRVEPRVPALLRIKPESRNRDAHPSIVAQCQR